MKDGFELRGTEGRGEGIFATRSFKTGEILMVGRIEKIWMVITLTLHR